MKLTLLDLKAANSSFLNASEEPSTLGAPSPGLIEALTGLPTPSGIAVTRERALRCVTFLAAVKMVANDLAKMPLHTMETYLESNKDGTKRQRTRKALDNPLYSLLKDVPNDYMTAYHLKWKNAFNLLTHGNFYVQKITDGTGKLIGLMPLNPWCIRVKWDITSKKPVRTFVYDENGQNRIFQNNEIWTCDHMPAVGMEGQSLIALAKDALAIMIASDETAGRFFSNGLNMHGVFTTTGEPPIGEVEAQKVVDRMKRDFTSSSKAGKFTLIPGGLKYEKMGLTSVEGQLLESRKWNAEEIARLIGGNPLCIKLGYGAGSSTNASNTAFLEDYFSTALLPLTVNIEQSITRDLIAPAERANLFVKHDADVILRGSPKDRADRDEIEIRSGKKSPNECRVADDLDEVPGWDLYFFPANAGAYDPKTGELFLPKQKEVVSESAKSTPTAPAAPTAPAPAAPSARLLAIADSLAERVIRKESKGGSNDAKFVAEVLSISLEKAQDYCTKRAAGEITDVKAALIALVIGDSNG